MAVTFPQTAQEIGANASARLIARGVLTDTVEGGATQGIVQTWAEDMGLAHTAIASRLASFGLNATGTELDRRVADIGGMVPRQGATPAAGAVVQLTRATTVGALAVSGSVFGSSLYPSLRWVQIGEVTIPDGSATYGSASTTCVAVVCTTPGTAGNVPSGVIDTLVSGNTAIITVGQPKALGGGTARESDERLRSRAFAYLAGQGGVTKAFLQYMALTFVSSLGVQARHVSTFYDPRNPGYLEVVVDDGTAFAGQTRSGATFSGTLKNGKRQVFIEGPVAEDNLATTQLDVDGNPAVYADGEPQWVLMSESNALWFDEGYVSDGTTWAVHDYSVYTGFVAELQAAILATVPSNLASFGAASAGCRIRAMPPVPTLVRFSVAAEVDSGADLEVVYDAVESALTEYCASLAPGQTFLIMDAYAAVAAVDGLANLTFFPLTIGLTQAIAEDWPPASERHAIRLLSMERR